MPSVTVDFVRQQDGTLRVTIGGDPATVRVSCVQVVGDLETRTEVEAELEAPSARPLVYAPPPGDAKYDA